MEKECKKTFLHKKWVKGAMFQQWSGCLEVKIEPQRGLMRTGLNCQHLIWTWGLWPWSRIALAFVFISHIPLMPLDEAVVNKKTYLFLTWTAAKPGIPMNLYCWFKKKQKTQLNNDPCWISCCSDYFSPCLFHLLAMTLNFVLIFFLQVTYKNAD